MRQTSRHWLFCIVGKIAVGTGDFEIDELYGAGGILDFQRNTVPPALDTVFLRPACGLADQAFEVLQFLICQCAVAGFVE